MATVDRRVKSISERRRSLIRTVWLKSAEQDSESKQTFYREVCRARDK